MITLPLAERTIRRIFVTMGSSDGTSELAREEAASVARLMAEREYQLVYGGGEIGLMGIVMRNYIAHNRNPENVIKACITSAFNTMSGKTDDTAEMRVEQHLHDRVAYMINEAQATIGLPGGTGSLHEDATVLAVADMMRFDDPTAPLHPLFLLNTDGFWDPLLMQIAQFCDMGMANPEKYRMLFVCDTAETLMELVDQIATNPIITSKKLFKGAELPDYWPKSFVDQMPQYIEYLNEFKAWKANQSQLSLPLTQRP